ncbi:lipid biosynthesis B12-binding/radical SAM protein [Thermodesulfobacteriota bacterium]
MKVLLISPNIESIPDPVFPIGLAYICGALKQEGISNKVLDLCFTEDFEEAIKSSIESYQPDVIGMSLRNLDNVSLQDYTAYLPFYRRVVETIRKYSNALIVLGGSGFSLHPQTVLEYLGCDYGIVGEGEKSFVKLINAIDGNRAVSGRPPAGIFGEMTNDTEELDELPDPDRSGFDNDAYLDLGGMGNIQTKRGCPFRCIYCTYPLIEGRKVRMRSAERVCDEIEGLLEYGITNLFIVDNTFNYPVEHAEAVCREIIGRGLSAEWGCYVNPRFFPPGLAELMVKAGCTGVEFGSDAAHDGMLENLCKDSTVNELVTASNACRDAGLSFCHSLLLGGPGETMESVKETLDNILEISPTAVICMTGIRVFPRTRLSHIAMEEGLIDGNEDFLDSVFYLSPSIEDKIHPYIKEFSEMNPTWLFPGFSSNVNPEYQRKLRRFGVKGPLWEYMDRSRRIRKRRRKKSRTTNTHE